MPVTKVSNPLVKWANESPSVVESPIEKGLRQAAQFLGLGDIEGNLVPTPPAITMFKDPLTRKVATDVFLDEIRYYTPQYAEAAEKFVSKYPRVAAHMKHSGKLPPDPDATASMMIPVSKDSNVELRINPLLEVSNDPSNTLFHEGTHTAQYLGKPNQFRQLYSDANELVGYYNNPFEINARRAGDKAMGRSIERYTNALKQLKDIRADKWLANVPLEK